jgi:hypothetical protein
MPQQRWGFLFGRIHLPCHETQAMVWSKYALFSEDVKWLVLQVC